MNLKDTKVLVTGGAGFIGSHLTEELVKQGASVTVLDNFSRGSLENLRNVEDKIEIVEGDIRDSQIVSDCCRGKDYVFHEAAVCINRSEKFPYECIDINIQGTSNVIRAALNQKVKKLVFASSASVYGNPISIPMTEKHPFNPITPYCISKIAGEHLLKSFARFGLKYTILRYFNVYGPRQSTDAYYTTVIQLFIKQLLQNKAPTIHGDGSQSMDFVNVKDVVQANLLAIENTKSDNNMYNVGSGTETTLNELSEEIKSICGVAVAPIYIKDKQSLVRRRLADIEKIKKIGYTPKVSLRDGLIEVVNEFRKKL